VLLFSGHRQFDGSSYLKESTCW